MAELLGFGASVIAVLQIAGSITRLCKRYIETVKDYPSDLKSILIETSSLMALLESLHFLDQHDPMHESTALNTQLQECRTIMSELLNLLPDSSTESDGSKARMTRLAGWPLRQGKVRKLLSQLTQAKASINLAASIELLQDAKSMRKDMSEVKSKLSESELRNFLTWLRQVNPSENHNTALALYETGTGDWVFKTHQWNKWLVEATCRGLWIHGIPGAGKTVLAAHLIETLQKACETQTNGGPQMVVLYYYCWHGRNRSESRPFLRWILSELCQRSKEVPAALQRNYTADSEPQWARLVEALKEVLVNFDKVCIVVDALDESQPRGEMLQTIEMMATDDVFGNLQILATSRRYSDIETSLSPCFLSLSLSNPFVEMDIKQYVSTKIHSQPRFKAWPEALRLDVETALSANAKGMFRLAVCQLDILRRTPTVQGVKYALANLPKDLDDTYQRIFSYITDEEKDLVRHVLRWTSFNSIIWAGTSITDLAARVVIDSFPYMLNETSPADQLLCDLDALKEACGCLVDFSDQRNLKLAHYTVREFLESSRSNSGHARFFSAQFDDYNDITELMFRISVGENMRNRIPRAVETLTSHHAPITLNLYCVVAAFRTLITNAPMNIQKSVIVQYFDMHWPYFRPLVRFAVGTGEALSAINDIGGQRGLTWLQSPTDIEAAVVYLMWICRFDLARKLVSDTNVVEIGNRVLSLDLDMSWAVIPGLRWHYGGKSEWPLHKLALWAGRTNRQQRDALAFLDLLHPESSDATEMLCMLVSLHIHQEECNTHCVLQTLIERGAHPSGLGFLVTPLQIATVRLDCQTVKLLLHAGADVNFTGQANGMELFHPFEVLHGQTPLFTIRNNEMGPYAYLEHAESRANKKVIEEMLLSRGGVEERIAS